MLVGYCQTCFQFSEMLSFPVINSGLDKPESHPPAPDAPVQDRWFIYINPYLRWAKLHHHGSAAHPEP